MINQCACCGTCCRNGGPPLHVQDLQLITSGALAFDDLVTVRRGELVLPPMGTTAVPAKTEWIKIQGLGGRWCCRFLDTSLNSCTIYEHRPSSCKVLKCWDTEEILLMAGRDLLARSDLINSNDTLLTLVKLQGEWCPVPDMENIAVILAEKQNRTQLMKDLTNLVENDLRVRAQAITEYNVSVASELFYFGRPLFQLLQHLDIVTSESARGIELHYQPRS